MSDPNRPDRSAAAGPATEVTGPRREQAATGFDPLPSDVDPGNPSELAIALRAHQGERWRKGERIPTEVYLEQFPAVCADPEAALDLIYGEFLLLEELGERPDPAEFLHRFPEYAATLGPQIELHLALATESRSRTGSSTPGSASPSSSDVRTLLRRPGLEELARSAPETDPLNPVAPANQQGPGAVPGTFGRYRIVRPIGRGGMGTVDLAYDTLLDREVALKRPRFGGDPRLIARFDREARILARFAHPNLCPVYDVGRLDGVPYLTMPFLKGETLASLLGRQGPLPEPEAVRIAIRIAHGMAYAHEAGVVHRDLKPANIVIDGRGEPIVVDFGLARREGPHDHVSTEEGGLLGTPAYLPPEQIGGDSRAIGPLSDVYSLGVVLYEGLAGRLPFRGSVPEILRQILSSDPDPISAHRPDIDPRLEAICRTALAKLPTDRFHSMSAFAEALEAVIVDGAAADSPSRASQARRSSRGRQVAVGLVVIATIGAAAVAMLPPRGTGTTGLPRPTSLADPLPAGSRWTGIFRFGNDYAGDVRVTVDERNGDAFRGTYATEGGAFAWEIAGTCRGHEIHWRFTEVLKGEANTGAIDAMRVDGSIDGNRMTLSYRDPTDEASLVLDRKP